MTENPQLSKSPKETLQDVLQSDVDQFTRHYDTFTSEEVADYLQNIDISDLDRSTKVALAEIMGDLVASLLDMEELARDNQLQLEDFFNDVSAGEATAGFNELCTPEHKHLDEQLLAGIAELRITILALQSYEISEEEIAEHIEKDLRMVFAYQYVYMGLPVPETLTDLLDEKGKYQVEQRAKGHSLMSMWAEEHHRHQDILPMTTLFNTQEAVQKIIEVSQKSKAEQEQKRAYQKMRNNLINRNLLDYFTRFLTSHPDPGVFAELLVKSAR